jgi:hypothetical protein
MKKGSEGSARIVTAILSPVKYGGRTIGANKKSTVEIDRTSPDSNLKYGHMACSETVNLFCK